MPTPCPFDPELGKLLAGAPPEYCGTHTPESIRKVAALYSTPTQTMEEFIGDRPIQAVDYTVPGYQGAEIGITVFTRKDRKLAPGTAPAFYYMHGGGMVMGFRTMNSEFLLPYVEQFDGVFAAVEYRLAPQHPHPVPVEDCYAGLAWFSQQGEKLGFDPKRIMVVGCSSGAGLAAGTALLARDRGGPHIAWQLLLAPMLDDRNATLSTRQYEAHGVWNATSNATGWGALLGDKVGGPDVPIYAAPARAVDTELGLANLPATFLDVGSAEVFRDEVVAYATGIWAVGGTADLHIWAGGFHGFDMWGFPRLAREALAARQNWVRRMLEWDSVSESFAVPL
ncbi:alpha/beta hydrolase domain-containing protein [Hypoxylon fragiforme]|uniref:alpha/beta hydrolase domain-containing protein n=1 Tax=Hypoxylon fragiforme TaxID=63214 RepID=UPI0020C67F84|nr:alpha/beta hydrolase domain-containing protein [Hypoxylon fragiforme]KAI2605300.1 alpha/beta hydrolase domain-containing protein [Hypoxylon fragiforme]